MSAIFEELAGSPNAHGPVPIAIAQEVGKDLQSLAQGLAVLKIDPATGRPLDPRDALQRLQHREEEKWRVYLAQQAKRRGD